MRTIDLDQRAFEGGAECLGAIRDFVVQTVTRAGAHDDDVFACELATDEAASNAFEHAYAEQGGKVQIEISRNDAAIVITVRNWGAPFDPRAVPEPDPNLPLHQRPVGGLGIFLIRKLMQDVAFTFDSARGNTITMKRELTN